MTTLTDDALKELTKAEGLCVKGEWKWLLAGEWVTRKVNLALKRGYLKATYYSGGRAGCYIPHTP